jgi:hypothetical protein
MKSTSKLAITLVVGALLGGVAIQWLYTHASESINQSMNPVAFIRHGAMFDNNGKVIEVTPEFVEKVQKFYLYTLLKQADKNQRTLVGQKQENLFSEKSWDKHSELYANSALIDWLIKEVNPPNASTLFGVNALLRQRFTESFELPDAFKSLLAEEDLTESRGSVIASLATTLGGAAYIQECANAGVPTPPDWGTSQWVSRGVLPNEFISDEKEAEVFTYDSNSPEGLCIALPRTNLNRNRIELLGIICLGKASSKACFWDNQRNKKIMIFEKTN